MSCKIFAQVITALPSWHPFHACIGRFFIIKSNKIFQSLQPRFLCVEMCIFDWESDSKRKKADTFITTTAQNVSYCKIFSSSELEKNFGYKNMAIELGAPVSNELGCVCNFFHSDIFMKYLTVT